MSSPNTQHHPTSGRRPLRPDIQGLRAVAVLAVLLWHLQPSAVSGGFAGVDVFFVISGFLMTTTLMTGKPIDLTAIATFYARRARRILPAAGVAIMGVIAISVVALPAVRWQSIGTDALWASGFVLNRRLAAEAVNYLAQTDPPSPMQHFWSLSVEEQFYLLWPALLAVGVWIALRRPGRRWMSPAAVTLGVAGAVCVASLAVSVNQVATSPGTAYFRTGGRLWELALGGVVAGMQPLVDKTPAIVARVVGWAALIGVLLALTTMSSDQPFPGIFALWPTLCTALLLLVRSAAGRAGPEVLLRWRPLQWVGGISYSLYLWHWPIIVAFDPYARGLHLVSWTGAIILALSFAAAAASLRWVESPFRRGMPSDPTSVRSRRAAARRGLLVGMSFLALGASSAGALMWATPTAAAVVASAQPAGTPRPSESTSSAAGQPTADSRHAPSSEGSAPLGAQALGPEGAVASLVVDDPGTFVPTPADAAADLPFVYARGCHASASDEEPLVCTTGGGGPVVAIVGDSHAAQFVPAFQRLAQDQGWSLVTMTKSNCPLTRAPIVQPKLATDYTECWEWNRRVIPRLKSLHPDLVVVSNAGASLRGTAGEVTKADAAEAAMGAGMASSWAELLDAGIRVAVILDPPSPGFAIRECVAGEIGHLSKCSFDRRRASEGVGTGQASALALEPRAVAVDIRSYVCAGDVCPVVVGGVLVYRDATHLTATYAASLASRILPQLPTLTPR